MFSHQTTYAYADNNPIRFIDFMGMNSQDSNKNDEDDEEKKKNQRTSQSDYTISVYGNKNIGAAKAKFGSQDANYNTDDAANEGGDGPGPANKELNRISDKYGIKLTRRDRNAIREALNTPMSEYEKRVIQMTDDELQNELRNNIQRRLEINQQLLNIAEQNKRLYIKTLMRIGLRTGFWFLPVNVPDEVLDYYIPLDPVPQEPTN